MSTKYAQATTTPRSPCIAMMTASHWTHWMCASFPIQCHNGPSRNRGQYRPCPTWSPMCWPPSGGAALSKRCGHLATAPLPKRKTENNRLAHHHLKPCQPMSSSVRLSKQRRKAIPSQTSTQQTQTASVIKSCPEIQ